MFSQKVPGSRALPKFPAFPGPPRRPCRTRQDLHVRLVLQSWAPSCTCTAQVDCQAALGRQSGLPRRTWAPFWFPIELQLGLHVPPGVPRTLDFARQYSTLATFSKIGFCASQVLLDCLLPALGPFLTAFWAHLGASWTPLGLNLRSLGRLWHPS